MKIENIVNFNKIKTGNFLRSVVKPCLCCFTVVLVTSVLAQENTQKTYLDPTDILEAHLNTNEINDPTLINTAALSKPIQIEIVTKPDSYLNFAANDNTSSTKLKSARITTPQNNDKNKKKSDLQDLIQQLNSVEIKQKITSVEVKPSQTKNDFNEPTKKVSYESFTIDNQPVENNSGDNNENRLKAETIKQIRDLTNNPVSFDSSFELGEILFDSNRLSDAYIFYERALESVDKDDEENRAWMLFQAANCLRNTDYSKAIEYYKRLLIEYPHSQWSELAKDQIELLRWYLKDDPRGLIKKTIILVETE